MLSMKKFKWGANLVTAVEKPLIGFLPDFSSMGETLTLVKIAKVYTEDGGKVVFFSHSSEFEYMAKDIGCPVVRLQHFFKKKHEDLENSYQKGMPFEKLLYRWFDTETIENAVKTEIDAFTEYKVDVLVSAFNLTSSISARASKIPLVVVISGVNIPPFFESGYVTFPEDFENVFTRLLPQSLKNRIARWYIIHNKNLTRNFNNVAKKYHLAPFKYFNDLYLGDHTLICDDINFLGIQPTKDFPLNNFIGPIVPRSTEDSSRNRLDTDVERHLRRPGRSMVVVMGSEYNYRGLIPELVEALNATPYNVIIVHRNIKDSGMISKADDNILFKEYVPLAALLQKVDLAMTHGGRGTIYTVAYSGKPAICVPVIVEHQFYIDCLVRAGAGVRLSKRALFSQKLLPTIQTMFDHYPDFLRNAQQLSKKLTKEYGEINAVRRLLEIYQSSPKSQG
jgi:UDP:flavonoid glycosyltransferase YjiC (YdhE family)